MDRISFVSSGTPEAERRGSHAARALWRHRASTRPQVVVALGGDGLMLQTLHRTMDRNVPVYGMNFGSVGFMMNEFSADSLVERLAAAKPTHIYPLEMLVKQADGIEHRALALNEVSLFRMTYQAVKVEIIVDGHTAARRTDLRRRPRRHPGRLHRLQPLGARPDPADRFPPPRPHSHLPLPPAPLARRHPQQPRHRHLPHPRGREAPGQRRGRQRRVPASARSHRPRRPHPPRHPPLRPRHGPRRAGADRTVPVLSPEIWSPRQARGWKWVCNPSDQQTPSSPGLTRGPILTCTMTM